ncbi:unnamed protein product [Chrysoparadoxa australica]
MWRPLAAFWAPFPWIGPLAGLSFVVLVLFADQSLLAPNLTRVALDLGLSEEEKDTKLGGYIGLAFFGLAAPASVLVGSLSDRVNRCNLLGAVACVGSLACFATAWVRTYPQLLLARSLTGIALGGSTLPLVYSLTGDLVPANARSLASGFISVALGAGQGAGQVVGGLLGTCTSLGWRFPFLLVSAASLVSVVLFVHFTEEPLRGGKEEVLEGDAELTSHWQRRRMHCETLREVSRVKTIILVFMQGLPGCIPWSGVGVFLSDFLQQQRGMSVKEAAAVMGSLSVGMAGGMVVGGIGGQLLYNARKASLPVAMGVSTIVGAAPAVLLLRLSPHASPHLFQMLACLTGLIAAFTGPNIRAVLLNVTTPEARGAVFGVYNLSDDLGRGLGALILSLLIKSFGRDQALQWCMSSWLVCGSFLLAMALVLEGDEQRMQARLAEKAYKAVESDGDEVESEIEMEGGGYFAVGGREDDVQEQTEMERAATAHLL